MGGSGWWRTVAVGVVVLVAVSLCFVRIAIGVKDQHQQSSLRWSGLFGSRTKLYVFSSNEGFTRHVQFLSCYASAVKQAGLSDGVEIVTMPYTLPQAVNDTSVFRLEDQLNPLGLFRTFDVSKGDDPAFVQDPNRCGAIGTLMTAFNPKFPLVTPDGLGLSKRKWRMDEARAPPSVSFKDFKNAVMMTVISARTRFGGFGGGQACAITNVYNDCRGSSLFPPSHAVAALVNDAKARIGGGDEGFRVVHLRRGDRCEGKGKQKLTRCGPVEAMPFLEMCGAGDGKPTYIATDETDPAALRALRSHGCKLMTDLKLQGAPAPRQQLGLAEMDAAAAVAVDLFLMSSPEAEVYGMGCSTVEVVAHDKRTAEGLLPIQVYSEQKGRFVSTSEVTELFNGLMGSC